MKIARLETLFCDAGWRPWIFLKATGDDGAVGWAEITDSHGSPHGLAGIVEDLSPHVVGRDPRAVERIVWDLFRATRQSPGSVIQKAIGGIENALLDLKGKALGAPVAQLLGGVGRDEVPVIGYLFIDTPETNARRAAEFVAAGHTELKLKVGRDFGQDHDAIAAIRDAVGPDVKLRIDANMIWSVPAAIKWIRGLEKFDLQYVEQPVPDFDVAGLAQVRRSVAVPIAADEACTDVRSALELVKQDACDVFVVYPSEAGGLTRARQIAGIAEAAGKWCAIGSWAELGVATTANAHLAAASPNFAFANDTHYPLQQADVLTEAVDIDDGRIRVKPLPGLGVSLDEERMEALASLELRESPFYDDIQGDAPSVGRIF